MCSGLLASSFLHCQTTRTMSSYVRVLNVSHVLPDQNRAALYSLPPPPQPLPDDDGIMKLTFIDSPFVHKAIRTRRLFLYEGPTVPPFPDLVATLRSSLATVLAIFFPLAGKLTYRPSADDFVMDCSPAAAASPGVKFVEAEYAGSIDDMRRVVSGEGADKEALVELGPELDARPLPAPVMAVQVTRPAVDVGGRRAVLVAVAIHHVVADGHSVWQFMRTWTAVARTTEEGSAEALAHIVPPTFDRTALRYPEANELASKILRAMAPALPVVRSPSLSSPPDRSRRSFLIHADEIQSVKQLIRTTQTTEQLDTHPIISTYVAVSSLVWTSIVRAKSPAEHLAGVAGDACYCYVVVVDYRRRRLGPHVNERYFGNCVVPCVARATARDLCGGGGDAGLARAAMAIRDAIRAQPEDPVRAMESWLEDLFGAPKERFTFAGSSNRFMAYETDFGWGKPSLVELVPLLTSEIVLLLGAEDGGVQVTVTLDPDHMEGFASNLRRVVGRANDA